MTLLEKTIRAELTKRVKAVLKERPNFFSGVKNVKVIVDEFIVERAKEMARHDFPNLPCL